jgi:transcriptional regulator with XRE-family HTH domain
VGDVVTGRDLRAAREAQRVSLGKLAEQISRTKGHLSRVERGEDDREVTPALVRDYERALGVTVAATGRADIKRVTHARETVPFDPMRRRTLITWGATAPLATSLGAVTSGDGRQMGRVGVTDVDRLRRATVRLHSLDQQHGGDMLWQAAAALVRDGYAMLEHGTYKGDVGTALLKATGRAQICAGWLAFDAGCHDVARVSYADALALGEQADDAQIKTRALANLAFQGNVLGRPREALRFAEAAEQAASAPGESPHLPAVPQLRHAIASALTADERGAGGAIARARTVLEEDDATAEEWSAFLRPAEAPWPAMRIGTRGTGRCTACGWPKPDSTCAWRTVRPRPPRARSTTSPARWRAGASARNSTRWPIGSALIPTSTA